MSKKGLAEKWANLDKPGQSSDAEEMWGVIRLILGSISIIVAMLMIFISETMEEVFILNTSLALWSIIIGIPVFFLLTIFMLFGDRLFTMNDSDHSQ